MTLYKQFYEKIIGFDSFIEIRCFEKSGKIHSNYFQNIDKLINFIYQNKDNLNLYCGVNPRKEKGRKLDSVQKIKNVVFDIEAIKEKKELCDENKRDSNYLLKLKKTVNFIQNYLKDNFNLDISAVITSGRGLHAYISINEYIPVTEYKTKYSQWYKEIIVYINANSPYHKEIKCDVMVKDPTRIFGAPLSINLKYNEKPIRKIIYYNFETDNKLKSILDKYNVVNYPFKEAKISKKKRYDNVTIFNSPEFKIFEYKPIIGTCINNKLRLALRLLMLRDNCSNYEEVAQKIRDLGYPYKEMNFVERDYPDYKYSESILNNYILDNFEWAADVGFKLPYNLKVEKKIKKHSSYITELDDVFTDNASIKIENILDFIKAISKFNNEYKFLESNKIIFYTKALEKNLFDNINNEKLKKFIEDNDLFNRLKYLLE